MFFSSFTPEYESKQSYLFAEPIRQLSDNQKSRGKKRAKKRKDEV